MFANKIMIDTKICELYEEEEKAINPPKIVKNATKVALKSKEFKSSPIYGFSIACRKREAKRIDKIIKDFVGTLIET